MVSKLDNLTHGETLIEETTGNISATVAVGIEAWTSVAMDEWFWLYITHAVPLVQMQSNKPTSGIAQLVYALPHVPPSGSV